MALTSSLRRILMVLLTTMALLLMVFYWNQSELKPGIFINSLDRRNKQVIGRLKTLSEKNWSYKCINERCVRIHYLEEYKNEKRVPFLTCSMTCGISNIWPEPTIKTTLGSKSLTISTKSLNIRIETLFQNVKNLFREASDVFLKDLKKMERINDDIDDTDKLKADEKIKDFNQKNYREKPKKNCCDIDNVDIGISIYKYNAVYLTLDTDESYNLTINHDKNTVYIKILAKSFFGARNGLSTLQQLIWYDDEDDLLRIISKAYIEDAPKFKYRGIMLDTSRHYFSVESIKRTLSGMAHAKLNRFHWHITDSQSFPYISKNYPQLAAHGAYSNEEVYTAEDIKEVVMFARIRGIQVIPEIDAPAHAGNGWDWGPKQGLGELSLCINQQPWSFYCGEPPCGQLNPKNNNTYMILQKLYTEMLEATGPTDIFHLGGDEVNLECWGQYFNDTDLRGLWCDFMLQAYQRLKIANNDVVPKFGIVWSSGLTSTTCLSKNAFAVQVWGGSTWQENYDLIDNGYNVIISHVDAWYLDCGFGSWRSTGEGACSPYRSWQNIYKHRPWNRMRLSAPQVKQILGGEACLWTEQVDESTLDSRIWPRAVALAERLWTDPEDEHDYESVQKEVFNRISVLRDRLVQLGIKAEAIFPKYCAQNQDECF